MEGDQPKFESVSPIFTVRDIAEALAFYSEQLEFEIGWTWGDPATYASVCRDEIEMNLGLPAKGDTLTTSGAYVAVTNIDEYYGRLAARGVTFKVPIGDRDYGMRDFAVLDPSGNHLSFGQPMTD